MNYLISTEGISNMTCIGIYSVSLYGIHTACKAHGALCKRCTAAPQTMHNAQMHTVTLSVLVKYTVAHFSHTPQLSSQSVHNAHSIYYTDDDVLVKHSTHFVEFAATVRFRCVPPGKIRCSRVNLNNFGSFSGTACFYSGDDRSRHEAQIKKENILRLARKNNAKRQLPQEVCPSCTKP